MNKRLFLQLVVVLVVIFALAVASQADAWSTVP